MNGFETPGWPWLNAHEPHPDLSGYRPVIGDRGMISTPHHAASAIGRDVLAAGGNAVDAAIAASAALMAACPMQCGPGGDAFWAVCAPGGVVSVLDAAGPSARDADPERLRADGLAALPARGGESVTVPGAVDGWIKAHTRFGSLPLDRLLEPAARLAENGVFASRHAVASFLAAMPDLREKAALSLYGLDGAPPLYARLRQPRLAATLRAVARSGGRDLYLGPLAEAIVAAARAWGGALSPDDLAAYEAAWREPVSIRFRGFDVFTAPPPSQGFSLLAALRAVECASPTPLRARDADAAHLLVSAADMALGLRDRLNRDGAEEGPATALAEAERFTERYDPAWFRSTQRPATGARKGETAHLAVVDRDGLAVSLIQSVFWDFGSCIPVLVGGFVLQNRGAAFSLDPNSAALLRGGLRPPHTLMPTVVLRAGRLAHVLGCMGGDGQMQTQLQLLVDLIDRELDPQQGVSRARWYLDRGREPRLLAEVGALPFCAALVERGHRVETLERYEDIMGHAQAISITDSGAMVGAADPRSDGQALAA